MTVIYQCVFISFIGHCSSSSSLSRTSRIIV